MQNLLLNICVAFLRKIIMHFLKKLNEQGKTIILVTHNPTLAEKYAKKIYWLKDGKIEKITHPKN